MSLLPPLRIDLLRQELLNIPDACRHMKPSLNPPVFGGARPGAASSPVDIEPVFDDSSFGVADANAENEAVQSAKRLLSGIDGKALRGQAAGIEALAWYCSFHDYPDGWGIYIPLSSLHLFDMLFLSDLPLPRSNRWQVAWEAFLAHEQMHFLVDLGVAWLELLTVAPVRRSLWKRIKEPPSLSGFTGEVGPDYLPSEEALANGFMLREARTNLSDGVFERLLGSVKMQPEGYCDGITAADDDGFVAAAAETFQSYLSITAAVRGIDATNPGLDFCRLLPMDDVTRRMCPVHIIDDLASAGLTPDAIRLVLCIAEITESPRFLKSLRRLSSELQEDWLDLKERIKVRLPSPPRFEKFKGLYSLRLRSGYRVHLRQPERGSRVWMALDVGSHKEMGHG